MQTKEPAEAREKAPPSTADVKSETPEKEEGPARPRVQRAAQPQSNAMPSARAAEMLSDPEPVGGAPGQAQMVKTMQQSVGNTRVGRMAQAGGNAPGNEPMVQRQPDAKKKPAPAKDKVPEGKQAAPGKEQAAEGKQAGSTPASANTTEDLKQKVAATVLAESASGQAADIRWVYYNRVRDAKGESGLKGSSAYSGKSIWYRTWLYMLGDTTYGKDALPKRDEFKGFTTIGNFCEKNSYMQTTAARRAADVKQLVDEMFDKPADNPYQGWIGQGNLDDFNNKSQPNSPYWKRARAYYWLQQQGKARDTYVKVLPAGKSTQFIFDAASIEKYYKTHALPADVPLYKLSE
jgi:hypothetical protein